MFILVFLHDRNVLLFNNPNSLHPPPTCYAPHLKGNMFVWQPCHLVSSGVQWNHLHPQYSWLLGPMDVECSRRAWKPSLIIALLRIAPQSMMVHTSLLVVVGGFCIYNSMMKNDSMHIICTCIICDHHHCILRHLRVVDCHLPWS